MNWQQLISLTKKHKYQDNESFDSSKESLQDVMFRTEAERAEIQA